MTVTTIPTAGIADDAVTIAKASGFGKIGQVIYDFDSLTTVKTRPDIFFVYMQVFLDFQ